MKDNYSELRRNTLVIAIANIGSRAISFFLAPLYSFYLTTEQYGIMDLITSSSSLIVPLLCLDIYEATFRFAKEKVYDKRNVISSSISICVIETIICCIILGAANAFAPLSVSIIACIVSAILDVFYNTIVQYARGRDKIAVFAFSGVLNSAVILSSNLVFMILLKMELNGWIISFLLAKIIVVLYLCLRLKLWQDISISYININFLKEALKFSLPLMPSASMWWLMNVSDRYILSLSWGVSITGIYAVANKLPSILSVFENIFYQAWQTTAINTVKNKDRDKFYSEIFVNYFHILCIGVLGILVILKPMIFTIFAKDYNAAWECAAILVIGIMAHALAGNLGALYTVFKDTKGALKTSIIGAVMNILLNLLFIPRYGTIAAAGTTLVSYLTVLFVRWNDMKQFVHLPFELKQQMHYIVLILIQILFYYIPGWGSYIVRVIICVVTLYINRSLISMILKKNG